MKNRGANMPYKLYTLYFLYFAGYISFFSFYALYLTEHGLSKSFLGLLSTGTAVANFISLVGAGVLADHMLSPRKIILASGAVSALWGFTLLWAPNALPLALLAVVPVSFLDFALLGSLDAWVNLAARHNSQVKYSVARGIGGLSGACASLILGAVLQVIGRGRIVWFHFAFYLLLLLVAAGVFLLVKTCTLFGAFQLLLEEGDYRRGRKLEDQRNEAVSTIYWCAVTAVYLAWSFLSGDWHITWVVWPVAGVFWGVIAGILSLVRRSRSKS